MVQVDYTALASKIDTISQLPIADAESIDPSKTDVMARVMKNADMGSKCSAAISTLEKTAGAHANIAKDAAGAMR